MLKFDEILVPFQRDNYFKRNCLTILIGLAHALANIILLKEKLLYRLFLRTAIYTSFVHLTTFIGDMIDVEFDKQNDIKKERPIPSGRCSRGDMFKTVLIIYSIMFLMMMFANYSPTMFFLLTLLAIVYSYTKYFFFDPQFFLFFIHLVAFGYESEKTLSNIMFAVYMAFPYYLFNVVISSPSYIRREQLKKSNAVSTHKPYIKALLVATILISFFAGLVYFYFVWNYFFIVACVFTTFMNFKMYFLFSNAFDAQINGESLREEGLDIQWIDIYWIRLKFFSVLCLMLVLQYINMN